MMEAPLLWPGFEDERHSSSLIGGGEKHSAPAQPHCPLPRAILEWTMKSQQSSGMCPNTYGLPDGFINSITCNPIILRPYVPVPVPVPVLSCPACRPPPRHAFRAVPESEPSHDPLRRAHRTLIPSPSFYSEMHRPHWVGA